MVICSNCGDPNVEWSENVRPNSRGKPKKWLINKNTGTDHRCISGNKPKIKNSKVGGMPCRFNCGTFVEFHNEYLMQPKFQEVNTYRQHTYTRCGNIIRAKGFEPPFQHTAELEIWDYDVETQLQLIKKIPPESRTWNWFRPKPTLVEIKTSNIGEYSEVQKLIRRMNLIEYVSLLIHLGHKKPISPPAVEV